MRALRLSTALGVSTCALLLPSQVLSGDEIAMRKGYGDEGIRKILGAYMLRVKEQAAKVSRELQAQN